MHITIISAAQALTKTFNYDQSTKKIIKTSYPIVKNVSSHTVYPENTEELHAVIETAAASKSAIIGGKPKEPLVNESRAGKISNDDATHLLMCDIDAPVGIEFDSIKGIHTWFQKFAPEIACCDYSLQFSSSNQFTSTSNTPNSAPLPNAPLTVKFHIAQLLDKPLTPHFKMQFIKQLNERASLITELNRHDSCISWAVDPVPNLNTQLIFVAPPNVSQNMPATLYDRTKKEIHFHKGQNRFVNSEHIMQIGKKWSAEKEQNHVQRIRKAKGLPQKTLKHAKTMDQTPYLINPDHATFTVSYEKDDFVVGNVNDGDSNAYWHKKSAPYFMYNFKNEPIYKIEDAHPEYWAELQKKEVASFPVSFAFIDVHTDKKFVKTEGSTFTTRDTQQTLTAWYRQVGIPSEEQVKIAQLPMVDFSYNPTLPQQDPNRKPYPFINKYVEPAYLSDKNDKRYPRPGSNKQLKQEDSFKNIKALILNVCGSQHNYDRFLNWLAFVMQKKDMTQTAWIFRGIQGTGKTTIQNIIRQMVGEDNMSAPSDDDFKGIFSGWSINKLFIVPDEADICPSGVSFLKKLITDKTIPVRQMYKDTQSYTNWANVILFTNEHTPITLNTHQTDRRFNITPYGMQKFKMSEYPEDFEEQVAHFQHHLMQIKVDEKDAKTAEMSEAKRALMETAAPAVQTFTNALEEGDLYFFAQTLQETVMTEGQRGELRLGFEKIIRRLITETIEDQEKLKFVSKPELIALYQYVVDASKNSPEKILKHLEHEAPSLKTKKVNASLDKSRRLGVGLPFRLTEEEIQSIKSADIHYLNPGQTA